MRAPLECLAMASQPNRETARAAKRVRRSLRIAPLTVLRKPDTAPRPNGDQNRMMRRSLPAAAIFVATLFPGKSATQIPDEFTNLQVLHDTLSRQTLIRTMKGFTRALGVRCEFCHVGDPAR